VYSARNLSGVVGFGVRVDGVVVVVAAGGGIGDNRPGSMGCFKFEPLLQTDVFAFLNKCNKY
jgi:hypothetical protein